MKAVGGTSAIADLAGLAIKTSVAAKHVVQSFVNAPKEVANLSCKCDRLRSLIEQIHSMSREMSAADATNLLLPGEPELLSFGLEQSFATLQRIFNLYSYRQQQERGPGGKPYSKNTTTLFGSRLNWALLEKRKPASILQSAKTVEEELESFVTILTL